jgi:hypothetical protein
MVVRNLSGAGRDDADAHGGGRKLEAHRQSSNSRRESCAAGVESRDQTREVVTKRERNGCGNERANLPARAEEQRLDRRLRHSECASELVIRKAADLAKHESAALPPRQASDRRPDRIDVDGANGSRERIGKIRSNLLQRERLAHAGMDTRTAFVARDRRQPWMRVTRNHTGEDGAMHRQEHLLRCVLRFDRVAEQEAAKAENHPSVLGKEPGDEHAGRLGMGAAGVV